MSTDPKTTDPQTITSNAGPDGAKDVQSDPAKGAGDRADWSDEGGATADGTSVDDA
ncbi:MAG: hypothetical protein ACSLE3_02100 [Microbacteriaceae bacterium]